MNRETGSTGRISLYDNMRFVLICLVVVGHGIGIYEEQVPVFRDLYFLIYSFHMPAFLFLTGIFHKNQRIAEKTLAYLCVGFAMKLGFFLGNILINEVEPLRVFTEGDQPWFMFVLAGYTAVSYLLRGVDKRFLLLTAGVFGCFVGYDQSVNIFLCLSRGFVYYPFYVLGMMCDRDKLAEISRKPVLRAAGAIFLAGWAAVCFAGGERFQFLLGVFKGSPYAEDIFPWGPVLRMLCYAISLASGFSLLCLIPAKRLPPITVLGDRTLQIYFWHWPLIRAVNALTGLGSVLAATGPGQAVWALLGVALSFGLGIRVFGFPPETILRLAGARRKTDARKTKHDPLP